MANDDLRVRQKPNSTVENKTIKPENKETKTGEVKPAEIQVGQEFTKTSDSTSDVNLTQTAEKRAEQQQAEVAQILADIEAMAKLNDDVQDIAHDFQVKRTAGALQRATQDWFNKNSSLSYDFNYSTKSYQTGESSIQDYEYMKNLNFFARMSKLLPPKEFKKFFSEIIMDSEEYLEFKKEHPDWKFDLSQSGITSTMDAVANYFREKILYGNAALIASADGIVSQKEKDMLNVQNQFQELLDNEGFVSFLVDSCVELFSPIGTTRKDVNNVIKNENVNLAKLRQAIKNKDMMTFFKEYRVLTGVNFKLENFVKLHNSENKYRMAQEAQRELEIANELEQENKYNRNYNLICAKHSIGAPGTSTLPSPLVKALLKLTNNNYAEAAEWIRTQTKKLGIENYPPKDKYNELVNHFITYAKTNANIVLGDKSLVDLKNEYETAIKNTYGTNISEKKLHDYMETQATAKSWLQTGVMIGCGMFAGPAALAAIIGGMSLLEKSTDKNGLSASDILSIGGEVALTYAGFKIFGTVTNKTMGSLNGILKQHPEQVYQVLAKLGSQGLGGATAGMFSGTVGAVVAGERDIAKILLAGGEGAMSGAIFALAFEGLAEVKEALKTPAKKFKDSYNQLLKVIKKDVPGGKEFLKSLNGQEYTEAGFQKVGEFLKGKIPKDIHFSPIDRKIVKVNDGVEFVDETGKLVSTRPETIVTTEKAFEYYYPTRELTDGIKMSKAEQELVRAMLNVLHTGKALTQNLKKMPEFVKITQQTSNEIQESKQDSYPFEPAAIKEVESKDKKPAYYIKKGYSKYTDTAAPTRHHNELCASEFNRYPNQTSFIKKLMQSKNGKPLSILNIGVAAGQEPLTHINSAYELAKSTGRKISDYIDLSTADILSSAPDFVSGTSETFPKDVIRHYEYVCDKHSQKSSWGTEVEKISVQGKKDVVLFNNVLQHMKDSAELKTTLEYLADMVNDNGIFCFEISGHELKPYEISRIQMMRDILAEKGFVETEENSGIFRKVTQTQAEKTLKEKAKDVVARTVNFTTQVATDLAPVLSVSLDKLPAVPEAIAKLAGEKAIEGLALAGTMKKTGKTVKADKAEKTETPKVQETKKTETEKTQPAKQEETKLSTLLSSPIAKLAPLEQAKLLGLIPMDDMSEAEIQSLLSFAHEAIICDGLKIPKELQYAVQADSYLLRQISPAQIQEKLNSRYNLREIAKAIFSKDNTADKQSVNPHRESLFKFMDLILKEQITLDIFKPTDDISALSNGEIFDIIYVAIAKTFDIKDINKLKSNQKLHDILTAPETLGMSRENAYGDASAENNLIRVKINNHAIFRTLAHETLHEYVHLIINQLPKETVSKIIQKDLIGLVKAGEKKYVHIVPIFGINGEAKMKMPEYLPKDFYKWAETHLFNNPERLEQLISYCHALSLYNEQLVEQKKQCKKIALKLFDIDDITNNEGISDKAYEEINKLATKDIPTKYDIQHIQTMLNEILDKVSQDNKQKVSEIITTIMSELDAYNIPLAERRDMLKYAEEEMDSDFIAEIDSLLEIPLEKVRILSKAEKSKILYELLFGDAPDEPEKCSKEDLIKYIISLETRHKEACERYIRELPENKKIKLTPKLEKRAIAYAHRILETEASTQRINGVGEYWGALEEIEARKVGYQAELYALREFKKNFPDDSPLQKNIDVLIQLQISLIDTYNQFNISSRKLEELKKGKNDNQKAVNDLSKSIELLEKQITDKNEKIRSLKVSLGKEISKLNLKSSPIPVQKAPKKTQTDKTTDSKVMASLELSEKTGDLSQIPLKSEETTHIDKTQVLAFFEQLSPSAKENVRAIVEKFKNQGLTLEDYTAAGMQDPHIFSLLPEIVEKRVTDLVEKFKDNGLTLDDYIKACIKSPSLFYSSPETLEKNVRNLAEKFKDNSLTLDDYIKACIKSPSLFYSSPETLEQNVKNLAEKFKDNSLTLDDYIQACIKQPSLFGMSPETIEQNVISLAEKFKNNGLTLDDYIKVCIKQPQLFCLSPETIEQNVKRLAEKFKDNSLTLDDYIKACIKQPSLFTRLPESIEQNVKRLAEKFKDNGLTLDDYIKACIKRPSLFCFLPETIEQNVQILAEKFKDNGLTLDDYIKACIKHPSLFSSSPETIEQNIKGFVEKFKDNSLTLDDYIKACIKQPSLFYRSPETLEQNVKSLVKKFKDNGLTLDDYIKACIKFPSLFSMSSETLEKNARGLVEKFKDSGLTLDDYIKACIKQPSLFCSSPETIEQNVKRLAEKFKDNGLTLGDYIKACIKQPSLFLLSPETIEQNVKILAEKFKDNGLTLDDYIKACIKRPSLFGMSPETIGKHINAYMYIFNSDVQDIVLHKNLAYSSAYIYMNCLIIPMLKTQDNQIKAIDKNTSPNKLIQYLKENKDKKYTITIPEGAMAEDCISEVNKFLMKNLGTTEQITFAQSANLQQVVQETAKTPEPEITLAKTTKPQEEKTATTDEVKNKEPQQSTTEPHQTGKQNTVRKAKSLITKDLLKQYIEEGKTISDISKICQINDRKIYYLFKAFGLKTPRQLQKERIENITQEQFAEAKAQSKNIRECCQKLGNLSLYGYSLLRKKFEPTVKQAKPAVQNYENYSVDELQNRILEIFANDTISNNERLSDIMDFAGSRADLSKEQKSQVIEFIKALDKVASGEMSINEACSLNIVADMENWRSKTKAIETDFSQALNVLYKSHADKIADLCFELFTPNADIDENLAEAKQIIDIINGSKDISEAKYRLNYFVKNADVSIIRAAEEYCKKYFGKVDEIVAGQYIEYANLYEDYLENGISAGIIPKEYYATIKANNLSEELAVNSLMKLDTYYKLHNNGNHKLNHFLSMFSEDIPTEKDIITTFMKDFYVKEDTTITAIHDNGTKEDLVLCSNVKREILDKYPAKGAQLLMKFENAMKRYAAKEKDTGIKYMNNCKRYEVKTLGDGGNRRLIAAPNSRRFDTFIDDH